LAITTVTYPAEGRARLVKRLLRHLGRADIPVAAGMQLPLRGMSAEELERQCDVRTTMNHACFAEPEDPCDAPGDEDGVDLIIRTVERHPGEVILACIAPLTNIASALRRAPGIAAKIQYIALMGGETALNRREHNIAFDDIAADVVLSSGVKIYMGTWDVTRRLVLTPADCERFRHHPNPLHQALATAIDRWHPVQSWKPGPVLYDLFPVVWAFARDHYTTTPMGVRVETTGELTRGMTIPVGSPANIEVTTDIRPEALRTLFLETVFG
jgi:inosine-uridine nucleoside N-ribohydrolase